MTPGEAVEKIQRGVNDLRQRVELRGAMEHMETLERNLGEADEALRALRSRGYQYQGVLEAELAQGRNDFTLARPQVQSLWMQRRQEAGFRLQPLAMQAANAPMFANPSATEAPPQLVALVAEVERFGSELHRMEEDCRRPAHGIAERVHKAKARVDGVAAAFKLLDEHGVPLEGQEGLVDAVKATWLQESHKLDGALFLTDRRLAFSWAEEVIVEKGWIFNKTKKVYHLKVNQPLSSLANVTSSEKGLILKDELLDLAFAGIAPMRLKLGADSDGWKATIQQAKTGELQRTRAGQVQVPPLVPAPPMPPMAPMPPLQPPMPVPPPPPAPPLATMHVEFAPPASPSGFGAGAGQGGYPPSGYASAGYPPPPPSGPSGGYPMQPPAPGAWGTPPAPPLPPPPPGPPGRWPGAPQPVPVAYPGTPGAPAGYPPPPPPGYALPTGYAPGVGLPAGAPGMPGAQGGFQPIVLGPADAALPTFPGTLMPPGAQGLLAALCPRCGAMLIAPPNRGVNLQCPQCRSTGST